MYVDRHPVDPYNRVRQWKKFCSRTIFKLNQGQTFRNGFLNRKVSFFHFNLRFNRCRILMRLKLSPPWKVQRSCTQTITKFRHWQNSTTPGNRGAVCGMCRTLCLMSEQRKRHTSHTHSRFKRKKWTLKLNYSNTAIGFLNWLAGFVKHICIRVLHRFNPRSQL